MTLKLEIIGPQAAQLGAAARKVFSATGGSIGRAPDNDWVIPDSYISGHHARIHYRDGRYLLEDTSTNGVFIKSPDNRLPRGQLHPLQTGDRMFIDAYEIKITVANAPPAPSASPLSDLFGSDPSPRSSALPIPGDPFSADPSAAQIPARRSASSSAIGLQLANEASAEASADPLELLGLGPKQKPATGVPRAIDLASQSPLSDHFEPPLTEPLAEPSDGVTDGLIPDDYDPLSDARSVAAPRKPASAPRPTPGVQRPASTVATAASAPPKLDSPSPLVQPPRVAVSPPAPTPVSPPFTATATHRTMQSPVATPDPDFAALLAAAGIPDAQLTPELAENFGRILQVVVAGVMDVLRARSQIKNEFRLRATTFEAADNNPLKFSANVEDALHNLLVKRNAAYLGPVEAFEDAFDDLRNHQVAMLAGMRVAFDAMLNTFEPDQLQEQFNRQVKRGSLLAVPAKLRYWDLYRDRFHDMVKDSETSFRDLFGEEFARAYQEQLARLKNVSRNQKK